MKSLPHHTRLTAEFAGGSARALLSQKADRSGNSHQETIRGPVHASETASTHLDVAEQKKHTVPAIRTLVKKAGVEALSDKVLSRVSKYWDRSQPSLRMIAKTVTKIQRSLSDITGTLPLSCLGCPLHPSSLLRVAQIYEWELHVYLARLCAWEPSL